MEKEIREAQLKILDILGKTRTSFALAGGTALELYYLRHRFSRDIDLFSTKYTQKEIDRLTGLFRRGMNTEIQLENKFISSGHAKVCFYTMAIGGGKASLKIDFVEDVILNKPKIKKFKKVPAYDSLNIYFQKITAITGTRFTKDLTGKEVISGRNETRDIIDLYYLSKIIKPLHIFLKEIPREYQRGIIQWHNTFSRQEFKLEFLDFEVYDKNLESRKIIAYLEKEIKEFIEREIR